jgi:hypothetical protein
MGGLGVEDRGPMPLGEDLRAPGVDEKRRVPGRKESDGRRRVGIRQRRARQVDELRAPLVPEAAGAESFDGPRDHR